MSVEVVISSSPFQDVANARSQDDPSSLVVSYSNMVDLATNITAERKRYIIDFQLVHSRRGQARSNIVIGQLVQMHSMLNSDITIVVHSMKEPDVEQAVSAVDKVIRRYVTEVRILENEPEEVSDVRG